MNTLIDHFGSRSGQKWSPDIRNHSIQGHWIIIYACASSNFFIILPMVRTFFTHIHFDVKVLSIITIDAFSHSIVQYCIWSALRAVSGSLNRFFIFSYFLRPFLIPSSRRKKVGRTRVSKVHPLVANWCFWIINMIVGTSWYTLFLFCLEIVCIFIVITLDAGRLGLAIGSIDWIRSDWWAFPDFATFVWLLDFVVFFL